MAILSSRSGKLILGKGRKTLSSGDAGTTTVVPPSDLVGRYYPSVGLSAGGSSPGSWTGTGPTLNDLGAAPGNYISTTTSPANTPVVNVVKGMQSSGIGSAPTGSAARSVGAVFRAFDGFGYAGFIYGAAVNDQSFGVGIGPNGYVIVEFYGTRFSSPVFGRDKWVRAVATYDGTTVGLTVQTDTENWSGTVEKSGSNGTTALNTGSSSINLGVTFSGIATPMLFAEAVVYNKVLSSTEINELMQRWYVDYTSDKVAPTATFTLFGNPSSNTIDYAFSVDEDSITSVIVTTNGNVPTWSQVSAGLDQSNDPADYSALGLSIATGSFSDQAAGLSSGTAYYVFVATQDQQNNRQVFSYGSSVSTSSSDVTAPSLSNGTIDTVGSTTASGSVDTANDDNGKMYYAVTLNSSTPSASAMAASSFLAITAAGTIPISFSGLTSGIDYWAWVMHEDAAGNRSAVTQLVGGGSGGRFTTSAPVTGDYDRAADTTKTWGSSLSTYLQGLSDTAGQTIIDITGGTTNDCTLSNITFVNREVVIRAAPGVGVFGGTIGSNGSYTITNGMKITGSLFGRNMKGITFFRMMWEGAQKLNLAGDCTGTIFKECVYSGPPWDPSLDDTVPLTTVVNPNQIGLAWDGGSNGIKGVSFIGCLFIYGNGNCIYFRTPSDIHFEGNFGAHERSDFIQSTGNATNITVIGNFFPRRRNINSGAHADGWQFLNGTVTNLQWKNNIDVKGYDPNPRAYAHQWLFSGNCNFVGAVIEGNIMCDDYPYTIKIDTSGGSGISINNNDFSRVYLDRTPQQGGSCPAIRCQSPYSNSKNFGLGASASNFGSNGTKVIDTTVQAPVDTDFNVRVTGHHHAGIMHTDVMDIAAIAPGSSASVRHWDNANPVGAWQTLQALFDTKTMVPVGWPAVIAFDDQFNANSGITAKHTGFDQYGNATY